MRSGKGIVDLSNINVEGVVDVRGCVMNFKCGVDININCGVVYLFCLFGKS